MTLDIAVLDLFIIIAYMVFVVAVGLWVSKNTQGSDDLFLAGRSLGWRSIGFSLFASNISSTTLIGLTGAAYMWGIAVANYEWMAAIALVAGCMIIVPLYIKFRITTVPEFLELRFDKRSRYYFSGLTLIGNIFIDTAGTLFAGAMVLQVFFPQIDLYSGCLLLAVFAGLYTAAGGLAAVVYTDVVQAIILLIGSSLVAWFAFAEIDFSWTRVLEHAKPGQLSLFLPASDPNLPWLGSLTGVPILGFYFWCTNQFITQRMLGAKSIQHARWGALFAGFLKLTVLFIMVIPGVVAGIFIPELEQADMVFPTLIKTLLPTGVLGIVLAALVAALMSSIDSTLNSAATLVTIDFIKPHFQDLSDKSILWTGRIAVIVFMLVAVAFAPMISHFKGLFNYLQEALAYLMPPMAVLFSVGVLWKRGTATGAFVSLLASHIISVGLFLANRVFNIIDIHFTVIAGILFVVGSLLFVIISLLTKSNPADADLYSCSRETFAELDDVPLWKNYLVWSVILIIVTLATVLPFI